ncbi:MULTISPECIES: carbohydrate ABC transporter permease [unclassified Paenibacillus]|uniref:carbohydrate ABC transporter permease n=1 Tax=unclassified Paenibacillus TaxID=185978 RepID=UPI002F4287CC
MKLSRRDMWYGYAFVLPMVAGYIIFLLIPIITAMVMSFSDWSFTRELSWVGWSNYDKLLNQDAIFKKSLFNTLYFSVGLVPLNILLALSLALLLNRNIKGIGLFRTAIFTPVVVSIVVWAIVWKYIFATDGLINSILSLFGIDGPVWLYDMHLTMPVVIVISVLKNVGLNMVIFLAGLQDVPRLYYEAASIDGASKWKTLLHITLPQISPSIFLALIITLIGSLQVFGQVYVMTGGGPANSTMVLVYYIYQQAFNLYEFGYASAIACVLFAIILALTIIQWYMRKRWVHFEN